MKTPKTAYVLKVFPRLSQTFVLHEIAAHERAGFEVEIFSLRAAEPSPLHESWRALRSPVTTLAAPQEKAAAATLGERMVREIRARGIEHLHAHFGNIATEAARLAAGESGITYSFTAHAKDIFDGTVRADELRAKLAGASAVVTVSRFNAAHIACAFGIAPAVVHNGLPLAQFSYTEPRVREPLILAVGRLVEKKGFRHLVDACALLRTRGVPFRCEIIGDGAERAALARQIDDANLGDRVVLLGARSPEAVHAAIRRASVLAAPCVVAVDGDRDGLPAVIVEAMALGTPVVSTAVTGIPEIVEHGRTGVLVPQADPNALAGACATMLEESALRVGVAAAARAIVEERFDADRNAARIRALFADAAGAASATARDPRAARRSRPASPPAIESSSGAGRADRLARGAGAARVVFRVHNRRGMGHLMRGLNIARALLEIAPESSVLCYARTPPPFPWRDARIRFALAPDPDDMRGLSSEVARFAPNVIVDDTIAPEAIAGERETFDARRVFIMRRCADSRQRELLVSAPLRRVDRILVPHTRDEFDFELPPDVAAKAEFVGPIVRRPDPAMFDALRDRYRLSTTAFFLLSTPGGGGFPDDDDAFFEIVRAAHARVSRSVPRFRHVVVRGPNSRAAVEAVDRDMTVVDSEPEMASLIALASAVISAGGYNSVNEIRAARRPAFFIPGRRRHDDQVARVRALADAGAAREYSNGARGAAAAEIAEICASPARLAQMQARHEGIAIEPGNRAAAAFILAEAER